jgi:hypothetical protein
VALKRGRTPKALKGIKKVAEGVQGKEASSHDGKHRSHPHASRNNDKGADAQPGRKTKNFAEITLTGSKGEKYTVTVPASYTEAVPKTWEWNEERYKVAEYIAEGVPIANIPDMPGVTLRSRMTIYGWLEHPEFKNHVDGLVLETGWANRRERMSNLQFLNRLLLQKVVKEIDGVKLTDKSLGAILSALQGGSKLIAQEKGEFIEESKVTQDTNITGTVTNISAKVEDFMSSKSDEERKALENEFDNMGDDIIRTLTGNKE